MTVFHTRLALLILTLVYTIRVAQRLNVRLFEPQAFFFFRAAPLLRLCCASAPLLRLEFAWAGLICNDACCVHNRGFRLQGNGFARRGRRTADIMPSSVSLHTRWFFPQHVCTLFFCCSVFVLRCPLSRLTHFSLLNVPLCFPPPRFFRQQTSLLTVLPVVIQSSLAVIGFLNAMLTVSTAAAAAVSVAFVCVADVSVQSRSCHVFTVFTTFSLPLFLPDESSCCSHHATADMVCILPRILHQHRPLDSLLCFDLSSILSSSVRKMSVVRVSV